jgi:hypothetical protein
MESDLGTCPKCGEDKAAGMSACHDCLMGAAPPEAFIAEVQASVLTVHDLAEFLVKNNAKTTAELFFGDRKGLSVSLVENRVVVIESAPNGFELTTEEYSALYSAIISQQSRLKKNLEELEESNMKDKYPEVVAGWEQDFKALEAVKAKALKIQVKP